MPKPITNLARLNLKSLLLTTSPSSSSPWKLYLSCMAIFRSWRPLTAIRQWNLYSRTWQSSTSSLTPAHQESAPGISTASSWTSKCPSWTARLPAKGSIKYTSVWKSWIGKKAWALSAPTKWSLVSTQKAPKNLMLGPSWSPVPPLSTSRLRKGANSLDLISSSSSRLLSNSSERSLRKSRNLKKMIQLRLKLIKIHFNLNIDSLNLRKTCLICLKKNKFTSVSLKLMWFSRDLKQMRNGNHIKTVEVGFYFEKTKKWQISHVLHLHKH